MHNKELETAVIHNIDLCLAKEIISGSWEVINTNDFSSEVVFRIKIVDEWDTIHYFTYEYPEMMEDDLKVLMILKMDTSQSVVNEASRLIGLIWDDAILDGDIQEPYWY